MGFEYNFKGKWVSPETLFHEIRCLLPHSRVICFSGEMGAGKTTFISALLKSWGVKDTVSSPTFGLVNEYRDYNHNTYFHFDFYRLSNLHEALDMGVEEYLYSGSVCLLEWPDKIEQLLPENFIQIVLEVKENKRYISISLV